jgi:lysophospholipase L1-like esterase
VRRPAAGELLVAAVTTVGTLAGVELFARAFDLGGAVHAPEHAVDWSRWGPTFYVYESGPGINSDGFRDVEHALENPTDRLRVAFLGDSVTFGFLLPSESSYPALVRRKLERQGHDVGIFNFSLPGWTARQARFAYEHIAARYRPDRVVLGVCLNDVPEMRHRMREPPWLASIAYRHSHLARWVLTGRALAFRAGGDREMRQVAELFRQPEAEHVEDAWQLMLDETLALASRVDADGARFAMLVLPWRFQVAGPDAPEPIPQRVLAAFAAEHGLPYLDALPALQELGERAFIDHNHLSPRGANAVARAVVRSGILGEDLVPSPDSAPSTASGAADDS